MGSGSSSSTSRVEEFRTTSTTILDEKKRPIDRKSLSVVLFDPKIDLNETIDLGQLNRLKSHFLSFDLFNDFEVCLRDLLARPKTSKTILIVEESELDRFRSVLSSSGDIYSIRILNKGRGKVDFTSIEQISLEHRTRTEQVHSAAFSSIDVESLIQTSNSDFIFWFSVKKILRSTEFTDEERQSSILFAQSLSDRPIDDVSNSQSILASYLDENGVFREIIQRSISTLNFRMIYRLSPLIKDLVVEIESKQVDSSSVELTRRFSVEKEQFDRLQLDRDSFVQFHSLIVFGDRLSTSNKTIPTVETDSLCFHFELDRILSVDGRQEIASTTNIFRVEQIEQTDRSTFNVRLKSTGDNDLPLDKVQLLLKQRQINDFSSWHNLAKLLTDLGDFQRAKDIYLVLAESIEDRTSLRLAAIYNNLGLISNHQGLYLLSLSYYQKSIEIRRKSLPKNHRLLGTCHNNLGEVQRELGFYNDSLSSHKKTLSIKQKTLDENDYSLSITYNNIALVNQALGHYSTALEFYNKSIDIKRRCLPASHIDFASIYNNLGELYREMGLFKKSLRYFSQSLQVREKNKPRNDLSLAVNFNNLGLIHRELGQYQLAMEYFQKSLAVKETIHREDHPSIGITLNNIGDTEQQLGLFSQALISYNKALAIQERCYPANHPDLATTLNNIGVTHQSIGEYDQALVHFQRSLAIRERSLTKIHPSLATSLNNIGHLHQLKGDYNQALHFYQRTLRIQEKSLTSEHPSLATTYNNMADIYQKLGDYPMAIDRYKKSIEIKKKTLTDDHPSLITAYNNIGISYQSLEEYSKALNYFQKAIEIQRKSMSDIHPDLSAVFNNLGVTYQSLKQFDKARSFYEKSLDIQTKTLPEIHPDKATSYNSLATVHIQLNEIDKALFYSKLSVDMARKSLPENHPNRVIFENYFQRIVEYDKTHQ